MATLKLPVANLLENLKTINFDYFKPPSIPENIPYMPPLRTGKPDWQIEREAYATELHIKLLEEQLALVKGAQTPQYDIGTGIISFMGRKIEIPLNTNLEMITRIVLKNIDNMKRKWSWDEIVEENREDTSLFDARKIYIATRAINEKVAQETAIKDFLLAKPTSTVQLNPNFLPK